MNLVLPELHQRVRGRLASGGPSENYRKLGPSNSGQHPGATPTGSDARQRRCLDPTGRKQGAGRSAGHDQRPARLDHHLNKQAAAMSINSFRARGNLVMVVGSQGSCTHAQAISAVDRCILLSANGFGANTRGRPLRDSGSTPTYCSIGRDECGPRARRSRLAATRWRRRPVEAQALFGREQLPVEVLKALPVNNRSMPHQSLRSRSRFLEYSCCESVQDRPDLAPPRNDERDCVVGRRND